MLLAVLPLKGMGPFLSSRCFLTNNGPRDRNAANECSIIVKQDYQ